MSRFLPDKISTKIRRGELGALNFLASGAYTLGLGKTTDTDCYESFSVGTRLIAFGTGSCRVQRSSGGAPVASSDLEKNARTPINRCVAGPAFSAGFVDGGVVKRPYDLLCFIGK